MNDCTASIEGAPQSRRVPYVADAKLYRQLAQRHRRFCRISDQGAHLPAVLAELATGVNPDQPIGTGYENRFFLIRRERLRLLGDRGGGSFAPVGGV